MISVLLPCRDAERTLPDAIRSLELQTFRKFEVVTVDDGSRDATAELLDRWAARDSRVRVLHRPREGLVQALRAGAAACSGELIARFDADDIAHPRRFDRQVQRMADQPGLAAIGTGVRYFPYPEVGWGARRYERWVNALTDPDRVARDMFVECPIPHPTMLVRRTAFERVGGYRMNGWPEDYDLVLRMHAAGERMANLPGVLHFWRERSERLSRTDPRYAPEAFRRCKIEHLRRTHLRGRRSVALWGAGRVGKDFARSLVAAGIGVDAFYEIDPRKIGQEIHGAPVLHIDELSSGARGYLLVTVGAPGARELIRSQLQEMGYREPGQFCCVA